MKVLALLAAAPGSLSVVATTLMLASCAHQADETRRLPVLSSPAPQLAQVGYGDRAEFVQCTAPQCPTRTQKTLGATPAIETSPVADEDNSSRPAPLPMDAAPTGARPSGVLAVAAVTEHKTWQIPFAFGSAQLGATGTNILKQALAELPAQGLVTVAGRTDNAGPASINDRLAQARAATVRHYLVRARPELEGAITVEAAGKCCFAAPNDTAAGRARNRRVEITVERQAPPP